MVTRRTRQHVAEVVNVLCAVALIVFAVALLAGWWAR